MVTTKKTSFPSLHSDQGHGLTKVWSKQEKKQITKLQNKEGLNASKSLGERGWEEGGLLEEGFNSQSVDISPKIIFTPKICSFCHQLLLVAYALFVVKSTRVPRLGGGAGGSSQSWQCQDSESFCYSHPSLTAAVVTASHWHYVHLTFTSSEFAQLMLQQLRQVYTKSCNYKIANNLDHVQTSRCVHIHHVQTRHCVHIHHVQTSTF